MASDDAVRDVDVLNLEWAREREIVFKNITIFPTNNIGIFSVGLLT